MSWESFSIVILFPQTELLDQGTVPFEVVLAEVREQAFAVSNFGNQPTIGGEIFLVFLHVAGDMLDLLGKLGNLAFNRTRVLGISAEFCEDPCFFSVVNVDISIFF